MAKPEKQPDGTWAIRAWWRDASGKNRSKRKGGFVRLRDAIEWSDAYVLEQRAALPGRKLRRITVSGYLDSWFSEKRSVLSPNTVSGYAENIRKVARHPLGSVPLCKLTRKDIQGFIDSLSGRPRTVHYVYRTLHAALKAAADSALIPANPAQGVVLPEAEAYSPTILSQEEAASLLSALREEKSEMYIPVLLSLLYGLHRGEALGLRWEDINAQSGIALVRMSYTTAGSSGTSLRGIKTPGGKIRQIRLSQSVLRELLDNASACTAITGRPPVFVSESSSGLPDPRSMVKSLNRFQSKRGLRLCRYEDLRRTWEALGGGAEPELSAPALNPSVYG